MLYWVCEMRCGVIWCYGDMVIWPALQARAFALVIFNCGKVRSFVRSFVVVRHIQKILRIVHAAAGARACPSNGMWRICDFDFWHDKSI